MQFETHRSHAGQFHWCLVGDGGAKLAVSATAFGSARDARLAAAEVRVHARSVDETEERR
jgi:uncharacterized protein YegP (UPF0339 family)